MFFFRGRRGGNAKGTLVDGITSGRNNCLCTDNLSVNSVLKKYNWRDCQDSTRKIKIQSSRVKGFVTILWVPSHYGVDGIEKTDSLADKGTKLKQKDIPITHDIARAKIKKQKWQILQ